MGKFVYVRNNKTKAHQPGIWKDAKKLEAVSVWLATGSNQLTSQQTGVPYKTIDYWKTQQWWKDAVEAARSGDNEKLDRKLTKALDTALDAIMDRIKDGEFIYDQTTGKVKRAPVKLRDANAAFNTLLDKRQLIRKLPTKITEASNTEAKLQKLAEQFAQFAGKKPPKEKMIEYIEGETVVEDDDGTYVLAGDLHAISTQREEGLSSGESLGEETQEWEETEGQSAKECS